MEIHRGSMRGLSSLSSACLPCRDKNLWCWCGVTSKTHGAFVSISCFLAMGQRAAAVLELKPSPFNPVCLPEVQAHHTLHHHIVHPNAGGFVPCLLRPCSVSQPHLLPIAASTISLEDG